MLLLSSILSGTHPRGFLSVFLPLNQPQNGVRVVFQDIQSLCCIGSENLGHDENRGSTGFLAGQTLQITKSELCP